MIVCYFNAEGVAFGKAEKDPPLVIDAYAVFPFHLAFHPLEPVAWKDNQVLYFPGGIDLLQFSQGLSYQITGKFPAFSGCVQLFALLIGKILDHIISITYTVISRKLYMLA